MQHLDWILEKQLSKEEQDRIIKIQHNLDLVKQQVPEFANIRKSLAIKKDEFIKQTEMIFQAMQQETINSITKSFKDFESEMANYEKYQKYIISSCQQLQYYLRIQRYNYTLSNQVERICKMNLNALSLIGQQVKQNFERDTSKLDSSIKKLLVDIEDILKNKIESQESSSQSNIKSILEDLNKLEIRILPLDEDEDKQSQKKLQNEYINRYFENSQHPQVNLIQDEPSQNLQESDQEQLEQKEVQDEQNQNIENDSTQQKDQNDICLPIILQDLQKDYQVIKTSNTLKEYPQRFNPQQISIPQISSRCYYSKELIVGGWDGNIELFDVAESVSKCLLNQHFDGPINVITYAQSSQLLCASASEQNRKHSRIVLLDGNNLEIIHTIELNNQEKVVELIEFNINENVLQSKLIVVTENSIYVYSLSDYKQLKCYNIKQNVLRAKLLHNQHILLSDQHGDISHYKLDDDLKLVNTIKAHSDWIHLLNTVDIDQNSITLLSGSYDKKIALREYNLITFEQKLVTENTFESLPQSLLLLDNQRFIVSYSNSLSFNQVNQQKKILVITELEEIQQICVIQNHLAISGKSDNPLIIII